MKVAIIACGARKEETAMPAEKLYARSTLFRFAVSYAKKNFQAVYCLSARHGLLRLTDVIEPYNQGLGQMHGKEFKDWLRTVTEQITKEIPEGSELHFFAGYKARLLMKWLEEKYQCSAPLANYRIGKQLKFLKERLA